MIRPASPQTIRMLAAVAIREFSLRTYSPALPVQTPAQAAPAVQMGDLPHVARHVLRLLARFELVSAQALRRETGRECDLAPAIGTLIRYQLIEPVHRSYRITPAGIDCAGTLPGHVLPHRPTVTH